MTVDHDNGRLLVRGGLVRFVRWVPTRDGWAPETLFGRFVRSTSTGWAVMVDDKVRHISKDEWAVFK